MKLQTILTAISISSTVIFSQSTSAVASTEASPSKPNIVVILADDLGYMDLGVHGSTYYETPHIDRLADTSLHFTDAHSAPVCTPTRAALMTGKSPARLHMTCVRLKGVPLVHTLPPEEVTIAELLRDNGYRTAMFGKWHLTNKDPESRPENQGFDYTVGDDSNINTGSPYTYFSPYGLRNLDEGPEGEYLTDRLTQEACAFMADNKDSPFFVYLSHYAVHTPLEAKPELIEKYANKPPSNGQKLPVYAAMIESLDDSVGKVLETIDELGIQDNTIVIFYSDNGGLENFFGGIEVTENAPLRGEKGTVYEGGIRVPLLIHWPNVTSSGQTGIPVSVEDIYPTIAAMAGAAIPDTAQARLDGVSLVSLLEGGDFKRGPLYWHYPHYHDRFPPDPAGAIRDGDWKLVEHFDDGSVELFNLKEDIGETNDLSEEEPERASSLQTKLAAWRERVGADMPTPPQQ